jgi:hypothetical protein
MKMATVGKAIMIDFKASTGDNFKIYINPTTCAATSFAFELCSAAVCTQNCILNGSLVASASGQKTICNVSRTINNIGTTFPAWSSGQVFLYDEVKFHATTLTAQDVQNDFAYGKSYTSRSCEVNGNIYFRF